MTRQCKYVLKQIKKLANNTDVPLRFTSDGKIYPYSTDEPFADCSKYKSEFMTIMRKLELEHFITIFPNKGYFRLEYDGIHPFDRLWNWFALSILVPILVALLTSLSVTAIAWIWSH